MLLQNKVKEFEDSLKERDGFDLPGPSHEIISLNNRISQTSKISKSPLPYFTNKLPPSLQSKINLKIKSPVKSVDSSNNTDDRVLQKDKVYETLRIENENLKMKLNITEQELTKQRQADTQNKQLINDLKSRNELLESDISHLHQITKQMKDQFDHERKALNESVRLNEKLKDNENFHDHEVLTTQINELEDKLKSQHRIVMELVDKNQENENVIAQKSKKLEKLKKQNILLAEKSDKMEIELEDVLQRYLNSKREYDSLHKWTKVYRNIVDDYEDAVQATELFADPSKRGMPDSKRPLLGKHVHKLLKDRKELYSTVVSMERDIQELQMKLDNSTQKHALELDQKKQQLSRCKESLKAAESLVIDIKQRFQETSHLLHKTELKCNSLEDEKRAIVSKYEENETDLLEKYNYKHRELRERFDDERCQLRCLIDNLQKEKVDLQAEIGQCLRDRRSYTNAYYKGSAPLSKY